MWCIQCNIVSLESAYGLQVVIKEEILIRHDGDREDLNKRYMSTNRFDEIKSNHGKV